MPDIPLYKTTGEQVGTLSLPESVFAAEPSIPLIHQAVQTEEARERQGTSDTKTRSDVSGGGRKPWRQKGTGRARQGSTRAPHWTKGGVAWGPHPRSYSKSFPTKMRHGALRSALSLRVAAGEVVGLDALTVEAAKTRVVVDVLDKLPLKREVTTKHYEGKGELVRGTAQRPAKVLVIVPDYDPVLLKSCRNIPYVTLRYAPNFSVRDVMNAGRIVLAEGAVPKIEEVLAR